MKITLKDPIQYGETLITELVIRKPKAKDMRGMPAKMGMDETMKLAGRLSGHPDSVIDELSIPDLITVSEVIGNFMIGGPLIGKTA